MACMLSVQNLRTSYYRAKPQPVCAVDGVSFSIGQGELYALVGESGCGKSTVARSITKLLNSSYARMEAGEIFLDGVDISKISAREMRRIRGQGIGMIFQNPMMMLNPVVTIGAQLEEAILAHRKIPRRQAKDRATELLEMTHIPEARTCLSRYPHQLSGGMQQRVVIAIALANHPRLLIADEPTTALDVSVQAKILDEMNVLRQQFNMGVLLITHNMGVVAQMCDRVGVMYGGVIVEEGPCGELFREPLHPYTRGLLACIPSLKDKKQELYVIPGTVPKFFNHQECRFRPRCPHALSDCAQHEPMSVEYKAGHFVRCFHPDANAKLA